MSMNVLVTNTEAAFDAWAKRLVAETGFVLDQKIYQGTFYEKDFIRNTIWSGTWKGEPAVLKAYDDPRMSDEPRALEAFNKNIASVRIRAPKLYASHMETPKRGWLIMEKLSGGAFLSSPLSLGEKEAFVSLYIEYRENFSKDSTRPTTLLEELPPSEFHRHRMANWLRMAVEKEADRESRGEEPLLEQDRFLDQYKAVRHEIDREFSDRRMEWCHGHFKPSELYRMPNGSFILTDFAHCKMFPQGYELAFMVWADCFMKNWHLPYEEWRRGIIDWRDVIHAREKSLRIWRLHELLRVSLLERCMGTLLADITASDRPREELERGRNLVQRLVNDLLV
jgi:hypothetical protein